MFWRFLTGRQRGMALESDLVLPRRLLLLLVLESLIQPELTGGMIATSSPSLIIKSDGLPSFSTST